jgi:hypothetical protein
MSAFDPKRTLAGVPRAAPSPPISYFPLVNLTRLIDGEAIVCDENGLAVFELIRHHGTLASAVMCAFDLFELDGRDLRRQPIVKRKDLLAKDPQGFACEHRPQ